MKSGSKGISSMVAAVVIIVALVIGAVGGYYGRGSGSSTGGSTVTITSTMAQSVAASGLSGTITLGALIPQTGAIPTGTQVTTALNMAIAQLNQNLKEAGITNLQFAIKIEDTQTNPTVSLTELQSLASQGIKVFLGPMDSSETSNLLSYADSNHLVLMETGTAATLADLSNSSYRFILVPNDDTETTALASLVYQKGFTCAVTAWRDDSWGVPFSQSFDAQYAAVGGKVLDNLTYSPSATDFTSQLTQMQTDFNNGQTSCGAGKVAVVGMEFSELAATLSQSVSYPSLKTAQWFTDDTEINDPSFTPSVGQLASNVYMLGVNWAATKTQATLAFDKAYNATVGSEPSSYTLAMYDGVFLAAQAIMTAGKYDGQAVHDVMIPVSQTFFGLSGYMGLNSNGDRGPTDYTVFEVNPASPGSATYAWQTVGTWSFATHTVIYNANYRS